MKYSKFLQNKKLIYKGKGFSPKVSLNKKLFDWQKLIVKWACEKGKAAIFADCGLGKTPMQLEWANQVYQITNGKIIILAPLAVSKQTKREGEKFGIEVNICNSNADVKNGINITNYEKIHKFDTKQFIAVVLDESGILKNYAGIIKNKIIESFATTKYKLCCTATPSPNDYTELGNHAEFLNIMTRSEMLASFFINDTKDTGNWRLKGHVKDNVFWEWLASWAIMMRTPSDIGFENKKFILPKLNIVQHEINYTGKSKTFFTFPAKTLGERRTARKESLEGRVEVAANLINNSNETWVAWCNLNSESELLYKKINKSVEVTGSDSEEHKENSMLSFSENKIKCLISKPRIAGFGMNWQNCHNIAFVGLSDSFEQWYQAIRRCWRFGQEKEVTAHIIIEEREGEVVKNIKRKERDMNEMFKGICANLEVFTKKNLREINEVNNDYNPTEKMKLPSFLKEF